MFFIDTKTKEYNLTEYEIRIKTPNVSLPTPFTGNDVYKPIIPTEQPSFDPLSQKIVEETPENKRGTYFQKWRVVNLDKEMIDKNIEFRTNFVISNLNASVAYRLDTFVQARGYDGILSASTYIFSSVDEYRKDAERAIELRDSTWKKLYEIIEEAKANNTILSLTYENIESQLPELTW